MPIALTAVPKSQRARKPVEEIDPDVITAVNEALDYCQKHPDERVSAQFDTMAEAEEFLVDARSYAFQAEPRLTVAGNATRKGEARFTVALWGAGDTETGTTEIGTTETADSDAA